MEKENKIISRSISRLPTIVNRLPVPVPVISRSLPRRSRSVCNLKDVQSNIFKRPFTASTVNLSNMKTRTAGSSTTTLYKAPSNLSDNNKIPPKTIKAPTKPPTRPVATIKPPTKPVATTKPPTKPVAIGIAKTKTIIKTSARVLGAKRPADKPVDTKEPKQQKLPEEKINLLPREMRKKIKQLENKVTKLTTDNTELQTQRDHFQTKFETVENDYNKLQEDYLIKKERLEKIEKLYNTLELEHSNLRTEFSELTLNYDDVERANEILQIKLNEAVQKIDHLEMTVSKYKNEINNQEKLRRNLHDAIQNLKGNIRVFCRIRPAITEKEYNSPQIDINFIGDNSMEIRKSKEISNKANESKLEFNFDKIFPPESSQEEVFEDLSQLIQSALDGYDICVFAYGQTGSGKTYTMQGEYDPPKNLGMIPRSVDLIFSNIKKFEELGWEYTVRASFLEIYNESIRDLLDPSSKNSYDLRFNEGKGATVTNLNIQNIKTAEELKKYLVIAQKNRAVAVTNLNEHSSRSHSITKIYLEGHNKESNVTYTGSVNLVDLAGSESAKTSAAERLAETKHINKSLSTLGSVMLALYNKDPHIPYRNSKLTFLLQSCLGGTSKTLMFVNISPLQECFGESINSLRFGTTAKQVKNTFKRNKNYSLPPVPSSKFLPT